MVASLDVVCHVITCRYMCKLHGVIRHCAPRQLAAVFEVEIVKFSTKKLMKIKELVLGIVRMKTTYFSLRQAATQLLFFQLIPKLSCMIVYPFLACKETRLKCKF